MARLTAAERKKIPASKTASGKKGGAFPLNDKNHIRAARSLERFASPSEKSKINAAARKAGIGKKGRGK
jgi:hypothetical protein